MKGFKLEKISVETAKLYEQAGLGIIVNELPFQGRVQDELRELYGIGVYVTTEDLKEFTMHVVSPRLDIILSDIQVDNFSTYAEALEEGLQEALSLVIDNNLKKS